MRSLLHGRFANPTQRDASVAEGAETLIAKDARNTATKRLRVSLWVTKLKHLWQILRGILTARHVDADFPFETTRKPSYYVLVLHLAPAAAVVVITSLNLYGYWIGKELSGVNNKNAPKELALQFTAKLHELLMLASLNEVLLTHLLKSLVVGYGLPFGSLTAGSKFKDLSYIWSRDFRAMLTTRYPRKALLTSLLLVSVILGVAVGPSSATALIPRFDVWPAGEAILTLNTSDQLLWPLKLEGSNEASNSGTSSCEPSALGCFNPLAWDSIGANVFSFWGHETTGGNFASPQRINVPGISSLRTMDIRLRDSVRSLSVPVYTVATIQHAVLADMVNTFRFLTFPSRSSKCRRSWSPAMCSYKDVSWSATAMQPVVITACLETRLNAASVEFPLINYTSAPLQTVAISVNTTFENVKGPQFHWVRSGPSTGLSNASIGAVVKLGNDGVANSFACTIQAQWARSTTSTNFLSTNYIVNSAVPGFDVSMLHYESYSGQTVSIDPGWALQLVESRSESRPNTTVFERFLELGETTKDPSLKLELIFSALLAESMAHTGMGAVPLTISSKNLFLKMHGSLVQDEVDGATIPSSTAEQKEFALKTAMTGYGYGLYPVSGLSASTLISMLVLYSYLLVTVGHVVSLYISEDPYIVSWRDERDFLLTCLRSRFRPAAWKMGFQEQEGQESQGDRRKEDLELLRDIVVVTGRRRREELSFRWGDWPDEVHG